MTTTSQMGHQDVGAYALGVLGPAEMDAFEAHLAECERCGEELDALMDVPAMLAHVELADPTTEPALDGPRSDAGTAPVNGHAAGADVGDGRPAGQLLAFPDAAERERRRRRARGLYSVAAAVVLIAGGVAGGMLVSRPDGGEPKVASSPSVQLLVTGEEFRATDPGTGTVARVGLESKGWGTHVALELARVNGPNQCQLIAIGKDGTNEVAMTWTVPAKGYGTAANPAPLTVHGGTSVGRDQLARFEVRTLDGDVLVTIPI